MKYKKIQMQSAFIWSFTAAVPSDRVFSCTVYKLAYLLAVFFALHGMSSWTSDEKAVCLSVTCVHCDKTEEKSVHIFIPYERSFSLVF